VRARNVAEVASASRLLSFDGSDDDCQMLGNSHIYSQPPAGLRCEETDKRSGAASPFALVGNVMHTGRTLDSGHYYADVLCGGSWVRVNDTAVSAIDWDPRRMQSPSWSHMAYIQIYACTPAR
jgi:hypothetical protein